MSSPATTRYELEAAPGGLALAQDLLNTVGLGSKPDLLGDLATASDWAAEELAAADVEVLRGFRDDLQGLVSGSGEGVRRWVGETELELGEDGLVQLRPGGDGARLVIAKVLSAVFEAQQLNTWRRLKTCRNQRCRAAFYDRSKNNSGVWHSLKTCGNPANLRAHRARNRARKS